MMSVSFDIFFEKATGYSPHPFQTRLAISDSLPTVWKLPTGSGKTATAVLTWLWRYVHGSPKQKANLGRRLVYCLPMRVLVEQCQKAIAGWLTNLGLQDEVGLQLLMGGEDPGDWTKFPEKPAILLGTQDMLISRALNRGYGSSRAKWPMEFGLLNSDCFWVMDEVQLMGPSLDTSAQLAGFRQNWSQLPNQTVWMSATIEPQWVQTVDNPTHPQVYSLIPSDFPEESQLGRVVFAKKSLEKCSVNTETKPLAVEVANLQRQNANRYPGTLTLVVINTVKRARELFDQIQKILAKDSTAPELVLLHSRFRPHERKLLSEKLTSPIPANGRLVVSTQVIEAGVDISASLLISELAPWPSLVQRLGRLNRRGDLDQSKLVWIDLTEKEALPYEPKDLSFARVQLENIAQNGGMVGINHLPHLVIEREEAFLLRRKDLLDLFDTTPDLTGQDIDISPYIREGEERDIQVYWRDISKDAKDPGDSPAPSREELCSIPVYDLVKVAKTAEPKSGNTKTSTRVRGWTFDFLDGNWIPLGPSANIYPGQIWLLSTDSGLYDKVLGWDDSSTTLVNPVNSIPSPSENSTDNDPLSDGQWQSIAEHTDEVVDTLQGIIKALEIPPDQKGILLQAARYHDLGKAHQAFQSRLDPILVSQSNPGKANQPIGKAPASAWISKGTRRHFRHELASALACLQWEHPDLVTYLVASHHGKVRQSIRSLPGEVAAQDGKLFARGVHHGDQLPSVELGGETQTLPLTLSLDSMQLGLGNEGQRSWVDRMIRLRNTLGCFHLAWLEAILRAADQRASSQITNNN
jgi:CRISPR-associated endonuclease/helicase Cas3